MLFIPCWEIWIQHEKKKKNIQICANKPSIGLVVPGIAIKNRRKHYHFLCTSSALKTLTIQLKARCIIYKQSELGTNTSTLAFK